MKKSKFILALLTILLSVLAVYQTNKALNSKDNNQLITSEEIRSIDIKDSSYAQAFVEHRLPSGEYKLILNNENCTRCSKKMKNVLKKYPYKKSENIYVNTEDKELLKQIKKEFETTDVFKNKRALPFIITFKIDNDSNIYVKKFVEFK